MAKTKTARIVVRTYDEVKEDAEALFSSFGLTMSDAINLFIYQSLREQALPFKVEGNFSTYKEMKNT